MTCDVIVRLLVDRKTSKSNKILGLLQLLQVIEVALFEITRHMDSCFTRQSQPSNYAIIIFHQTISALKMSFGLLQENLLETIMVED